MIKFVVKRDGRTVDFSPSSLNKWGAWAAQSLGSLVDWSSVVLEAASSLPETVTSKQLQERLIKVCLDRGTWSYNRMAGRLYASLIHKNLYDEENIKTRRKMYYLKKKKEIYDKLFGMQG